MIELKCKECGAVVSKMDSGVGKNVDCYCEKHIPLCAIQCISCGLIADGSISINDLYKA